MPLVLLEALAMGLPVVATDIPGSRDVIVHGVNGVLVPPDDATALREALLGVATDVNGYRRMSEASRRLAGPVFLRRGRRPVRAPLRRGEQWLSTE